jgi:hypothetical protein
MLVALRKVSKISGWGYQYQPTGVGRGVEIGGGDIESVDVWRMGSSV